MKIGIVEVSDNLLIGAAVAAVAYFVLRGGVRGVASDIGAAPFELTDGLLSGAVTGAGGLVGVPATNVTQCDKDLAAGRTWDASFSCPAKRWLGSLFD